MRQFTLCREPECWIARLPSFREAVRGSHHYCDDRFTIAHRRIVIGHDDGELQPFLVHGVDEGFHIDALQLARRQLRGHGIEGDTFDILILKHSGP